MTAHIDAAIMSELPGGLPHVCLIDIARRPGDPPELDIWWPGLSDGWLDDMRGGRIPLPGPDNLNAAGCLFRLAQVVGLPLHVGELPQFEAIGPSAWAIDTLDASCYVYAEVPRSIRADATVVGCPALADITDPMEALAAIVTYLSLLHGLYRRRGFEVPAGVVPGWGWSEEWGCWDLRVGDQYIGFTALPEGGCDDWVRVPALADTGDDPAASLRACREASCSDD